MNENNRINEEDLQKIQGGAIDWTVFASKFMQAFKTYEGTITDNHKQIIEAIKQNDIIGLATKVTPLVASDPLIKRVIIECM